MTVLPSRPTAHRTADRTAHQPRDVVGRWSTVARRESSLRLVPAPALVASATPADRGRDLAVGYLAGRHGLDEHQAVAVWDRLVQEGRERQEALTLAAAQPVQGPALEGQEGQPIATDPPKDPVQSFVQHCAARSAKVAGRGDEAAADGYRTLAADPPADPAIRHAVMGMPKAGHEAVKHLANQVRAVAALTGVDHDVVSGRIAALREQYEHDLAHLPADVRPAPPETWVRGFTSKDATATSCPADPATLYAFYRAQADVRVFTDAERGHPTFASTDLETAAPNNPSGFQARNGHIIEVGVVIYDDTGAEVGRYEQLIRPPQSAIDSYGTGRADIHHIEVADLDGCPSWATVAPVVRRTLAGHTLLAQGARFERSWLGHHLKAAGQTWDRDCIGVDTLTIAQQHYPDLERHRLGYICEGLGVPYTNGHRAMHDALAAGRAFFAMRSAIRARYAADPRFAGLPRP